MNIFYYLILNLIKFVLEACILKWNKQRQIYRNISTLLLKHTWISARAAESQKNQQNVRILKKTTAL